MRKLATPIRMYIIGVTLAALALFSGLARSQGMGTVAENATMAGVLMGLIVLACNFPIHFSAKTKVSVATIPILTSLLVFGTPAAMLISALGMALSEGVFLKRRWFNTLFNAAQTALYVGLGGLVYYGLVSDPLPRTIDTPQGLLALTGTAAVMHLANSAIVAGIASLQLRRSIAYIWLTYIRNEWTQNVALYVLGPVAALLAQMSPGAALMMIIPAAIIYRSFHDTLLLKTQTKQAVEGIADLVDMRDSYTYAHSQRVARYAAELAASLKLSEETVETIELAARVHDLGKLTIDTVILRQDSELNPLQWELVRHHPVVGAQIVSAFPHFRAGQELVMYHQERYDGSGYPRGLRGEEIPLGARIIAVADAYDAMTSDRPYRPALPLPKVLQEFERYKGRYWDPGLVEVMCQALRELLTKGNSSLMPSLSMASGPGMVRGRNN